LSAVTSFRSRGRNLWRYSLEEILPRVSVDELDKRGSFEIVSATFSLGTKPAATVMAEVKPMLGNYGKMATSATVESTSRYRDSRQDESDQHADRICAQSDTTGRGDRRKAHTTCPRKHTHEAPSTSPRPRRRSNQIAPSAVISGGTSNAKNHRFSHLRHSKN
jgi:hypothetical protein